MKYEGIAIVVGRGDDEAERETAKDEGDLGEGAEAFGMNFHVWCS
jgi:hypothetical protein